MKIGKLITIISLACFVTHLISKKYWVGYGEPTKMAERKSHGNSKVINSRPESSDSAATKVDSFQALMNAAITFYGIVLDQDENPVPLADVTGSVLNSWKSSPISMKTNSDGKFIITSKGTALTVEVGKKGYYRVDKNDRLNPSTQGFDFGIDDSPRLYNPDPENPTKFHLRKENSPVIVEKINTNTKIPRDGSAATLKISKTSKASLQIKCRTLEDPKQPPNAPYDWRCEITVAGGGIQEAVDEHTFFAPEEGYEESFVIDMPKTLDRKLWNRRANKFFWLRFPDKTFGRISFMMIAGGDHFAVIQGFRNPTPEDRNLEPKLDER